MKKQVFGLVGAAAVLTFTVVADVTIDTTRAEIVSPGGLTKQAAQELQLHLKKITGVEVPIRVVRTPGVYSFLLQSVQLGANAEACEWKVGETEAIFRGEPYFAVIDFLEGSLGVRWPGEEFIIAPSMNPLVVTKTEGAYAPELNIRQVRYTGLLGQRARLGRHNPPDYGHAFTKYWKRFGKTHPEYFAQRTDGIRAPIGVKSADLIDNIAVYLAENDSVGMCVSSTGFQNQVIADWQAAGTPEYINLCENDVGGTDSCHCPACTALDAPIPPNADLKAGHFYADRYVWFGNRILELARKIRPDVKVCYYAYNATQDAPRRYRVDEGAVVGLVPTIFTYEAIDAYVDSWKKMGLKNFFYRPNRHHYYGYMYLPLGMEEHFFNVLQKLVKAGCIGFDYDANVVSDFHACLERYILSHALQDPSKSFAYWEDHYLDAFGAAREEARGYYHFWRDVWNARIEPNLAQLTEEGKWYNVGRGIIWRLKDFFRAEDFDRAATFLDAAEKKSLTPDQRALLARLRLDCDHGRLFVESIVHKSEANTRALVAFRDQHGIPRYEWAEQYYGDVCGVEKMFGPQFDPQKISIVSSSSATQAVAEELQQALEKITGVKMPLGPSGAAAHQKIYFDPTPVDGRAAAFAWEIKSQHQATTFRGNLRSAVRDYLEKALNIKFGADGKPVYTKRNPLYFDALKGSDWRDSDPRPQH